MSRGESFAGQFRNPVTEIIVTLRDKATSLAVKGMAYKESCIAAVTVMGEVWGI